MIRRRAYRGSTAEGPSSGPVEEEVRKTPAFSLSLAKLIKSLASKSSFSKLGWVVRLKPQLTSVSLSDDLFFIGKLVPSALRPRLHSTKPPSFSSSTLGDGHPEMILRFCEIKRGRCEA
ncbi:hypothetical protein NL676_031219 [Syzygium grande]|nr:hypothetical protein NL676_031219 [Syzygium grande]